MSVTWVEGLQGLSENHEALSYDSRCHGPPQHKSELLPLEPLMSTAEELLDRKVAAPV
jgi:hypothetical protein